MENQLHELLAAPTDVSRQPLVSIITPTYNHERFIGACIESVLAQTYTNWKMIIVDDGSTDSTWDIVQSYSAKDNRIRAFRQENKGIWKLAETYNFALQQSCGDLVAVLEGDDRWSPDKLSKQVPFHVNGNFALTFGQTKFIDINGAVLSSVPYPDPKTLPFLQNQDSSDLFRRLLRGEYFAPALTVIISRDCLVEIGSFQQPLYLPVVDYPTWLSVGRLKHGIGFVNSVLGNWRQSSDQTTWLLARTIAQGVFQYAQEFAAQNNDELRLPPGKNQKNLLSVNRRRYLADASYRTAALAIERGHYRQALHCWAEIATLRQFRLLARFTGMFGWKAGRKFWSKARRSVIHSPGTAKV